ncbi:MAG: energy transducer TonB [Candidatus Zixiibacteriota bacterium]
MGQFRFLSSGMLLLAALALLFGTSVLAKRPSAIPPSSVVVSADSVRDTFPSSYDNSIPYYIRTHANLDFAMPVVTEVRPMAASGDVPPQPAIVWMKIRLNQNHTAKQAEIKYCSLPNRGYERAAMKAVLGRNFETVSGENEPPDWLWHQVLFTGEKQASLEDSLGIPCPDDSPVCEIWPIMIEMRKPQYPRTAKRQGRTGTVWVKSLIDKKGMVRSSCVGKSSGWPELDKAAVAASFGNRYKPALEDGRAIAIWVTYKVDFKLDR